MIENDDLKLGREIAAISKTIDNIMAAVEQARAELEPQPDPETAGGDEVSPDSTGDESTSDGNPN